MVVFHWSLSEGKSPKVSGTPLSILADHNNVVAWTFSTRPVISKFPILCTNPSVFVPRAPITIGMGVDFMFHSFSIH